MKTVMSDVLKHSRVVSLRVLQPTAMVTAMDEAIGNITQTYKDQGLWENTMMIFTTDVSFLGWCCMVSETAVHWYWSCGGS